MKHRVLRFLFVSGVVLCVTTVCFAFVVESLVAHPPEVRDRGSLANREPDQTLDAEEEAFIHTSPGFEKPGKPAVAGRSKTATLEVTIVDAKTGKPTACRVSVVGSDGNYYEPEDFPLRPFSRHRTAPNETHGPSRYFGFFFYTRGNFRVRVPAGMTRIEAWKGFEYPPLRRDARLSTGTTESIRLEMVRTVPMDDHGYYSGDTHIHLNRSSPDDDERALDLMAAEDIQYGFVLCMNDPRTYSGRMDRQLWPQTRGLGAGSVRARGPYGIVSGQEYRARTYGHVCLLMHERLVLEGLSVDPNNWPVFGSIGRETRQLGGYSFHAHGGYSREIFADYVQEATDGVELLQMAHYRGIGLTFWYRILNLGFRYPAVAGSDYPYNRALGDCRNYVYAKEKPSFADWARGAAEGRSFFTTGPLLLLEVNGRRPGDIIELPGGSPRAVDARIRVRSEITSVNYLDLIVNGETVRRVNLAEAGRQQGQWYELRQPIEIDRPSWLAARAFGLSSTGRPDAEAHTNPVYVYLDGQPPFEEQDLELLLEQLDARIAALEKREFPEKDRALQYYEKSRRMLLDKR